MAASACAAPSDSAATPIDPGCGVGETIANLDLNGVADVDLTEAKATAVQPAKAEARLLRAVYSEAGRRRTVLTLCDQANRVLWSETVSDIAPDGSGYRSFNLAATAGELRLYQTTLPAPGDTDFMPGPPLELVFRRGGDGRYERAR